QAYREGGSLETMRGQDKVFAVERRGGYPWAEGYLNRNDDAPLPAPLRHDGTPAGLAVRLCDLPGASGAVTLRLVLFGAREGDEITASLDGEPLPRTLCDHQWHDPQLFSPAPQPPSGGSGEYQINPDQRLTRLECAVPVHLCREGPNVFAVAVASRLPYCNDEIVVEKLEVHVRYE
ncbi:MAG: hypothetical protein WCP21_18860, partial [Armatimonadota bacterium]